MTIARDAKRAERDRKVHIVSAFLFRMAFFGR